MNKLMNASPIVQNSVATVAIVLGVAVITTAAAKLGEHWSAQQLKGMRRASRTTLKNLA